MAYVTTPTTWYYVNSDQSTDLYGNDTTGDGSATNPWRTAAKAKSVLGTVTTPIGLRVAGEHPPLTWDNCIDFTIEGWNTVSQGWFSARTSIAAASWTFVSGTTYTCNIGSGKTLGWDGLTIGGGTTGMRGGVVVNYKDRYDSTGHYGHYKWVSGAGTAGSWDYNNTTGVLTINLAAQDSDPSAQADGYVCWVDTAVNCLQMHNSTRCTIRNLKFGPVCGSLGLTGLNYCFIGSGNVNRFEGNLCVDGGYHGWGWVSFSNVNNTITGNFVRGMLSHPVSPNVTLGVVHSSTTHSGNRCSYNEYHCFSYRYPDGTFIDTSTSLDGLHVHTSGTTVLNFEVYRDKAVGYSNPSNGFTAVDIDVSSIPADDSAAELDPNRYHYRAIECVIQNGYTAGFVPGGALVRCVHLCTNSLSSDSPRYNTTGYSTAHKMLMLACYSAANLYATASNNRSFFWMQRGASNASRLVAVNCDFVDVAEAAGSGTPYWPRLMTWIGASDTGSVRIIGCVIMGTAGKGITLSVNESAVQGASSAFTFTRNWYYQIDPNAWLYGTVTLDTFAEFSASKDASGVYSTNPNFSNVLTGATPTSNGNLATTKYVNATRADTGVNGRPYNGRYGAWQDGGGTGGGLMTALDLL